MISRQQVFIFFDEYYFKTISFRTAKYIESLQEDTFFQVPPNYFDGEAEISFKMKLITSVSLYLLNIILPILIKRFDLIVSFT